MKVTLLEGQFPVAVIVEAVLESPLSVAMRFPVTLKWVRLSAENNLVVTETGAAYAITTRINRTLIKSVNLTA